MKFKNFILEKLGLKFIFFLLFGARLFLSMIPLLLGVKTKMCYVITFFMSIIFFLGNEAIMSMSVKLSGDYSMIVQTWTPEREREE